jgi:hypothetical protein
MSKEIGVDWWRNAPQDICEGLREDQKAAFACAADMLNEVVKTEHHMAVATMWAGEKDLLGNVPIFFNTNLKGDGVARIIDHAYRRLVKVGRIKPTTDEPSKTITVHVEGGLVQDVTGIPAGYEVRVEDYDHQNPGDDSWDAEKECVVTVYGGEGV